MSEHNHKPSTQHHYHYFYQHHHLYRRDDKTGKVTLAPARHRRHKRHGKHQNFARQNRLHPAPRHTYRGAGVHAGRHQNQFVQQHPHRGGGRNHGVFVAAAAGGAIDRAARRVQPSPQPEPENFFNKIFGITPSAYVDPNAPITTVVPNFKVVNRAKLTREQAGGRGARLVFVGEEARLKLIDGNGQVIRSFHANSGNGDGFNKPGYEHNKSAMPPGTHPFFPNSRHDLVTEDGRVLKGKQSYKTGAPRGTSVHTDAITYGGKRRVSAGCIVLADEEWGDFVSLVDQYKPSTITSTYSWGPQPAARVARRNGPSL